MRKYLYATFLALLAFSSGAGAQQQQQPKIKYAPRLVVTITVDQLRTDYMEAFAPLYGQDGFKRLLKDGMVFENASYPFTGIDRASAVASLATGVSPYYHSIVAEQWLDRETLRPVYCVGDERETTPAHLLTSTLGDELKVATNGAAVVCGVAPSRDAAVLSAGHAADGAYWIDTNNGQWTTSPYYQKQSPAWINSFNEQSAPSKTIAKAVWDPVIELSGTFNYYQHVGNQKPFRHKFTKQNKFAEYTTSGLVNAHVTDMALQLVGNNAMGTDRVTDLLAVTYYAGNFAHKPLNDCQMELQDTYVRLDAELARLVKNVESRLGADHVLFVITSTGYSDDENTDYEKLRIPTGTFYINRSANLLNMYYGAIWGSGRWVESCFHNQMFLNRKLLESRRLSLTDAMTRAQEFLSQVSGVRNIYTSLQLISGQNQQFQKVRNGFNPERCGDILIEVSPGWRLFNEDNQDSQLSRASFTQFPIIIFGANTKADRIKDHVTVDRIAPTIAKIIRIRAPNACSAEPLY
jgi:hypothetical protein